MHSTKRSTAALLPILAVILGAGCADTPAEPDLAAPGDLLLSMHGKGATTGLQEFSFDFPPVPFPAPCLGADFTLSGVVPGWIRFTQTPNGQVHATERWDFSGLTAMAGGETWSAAPGAGELFSYVNFPGSGGSGTPVVRVVHQGRSRFVSDGEGPDVLFVHRFIILRLPSGEFQFTRSETEVAEIQCLGPQR